VRIGTWNVNRAVPDDERGDTLARWVREQQVDLWLLTEVHSDWRPRGRELIVSPRRSYGAERQRWAAIETRATAVRLAADAGVQHPGEEGLALARVEHEGVRFLVACSVLPIRDSGKNWQGLPQGRGEQFRFVLDHHVSRIRAARQDGEPIIWGGDFTQELTPPYSGGPPGNADALRSAFDGLELSVLTAEARRLNPECPTIDHLAVSREIAAGSVEVHRPTWPDGVKSLSDHAAYTADVGLPRT
jgi:endonuclease/exonuclease/phosphatase family metal-dependent hydrolase